MSCIVIILTSNYLLLVFWMLLHIIQNVRCVWRVCFKVTTIFDQQSAEISQCMKRFDSKPDDLGLLPRTHMVEERELDPTNCFLSSIFVCWNMHVHTHPPTPTDTRTCMSLHTSKIAELSHLTHIYQLNIPNKISFINSFFLKLF